MKTISRYIMTLALLLTAVTGAWATDPKVYTEPVAISSLHVGDILATGFSLTPASNLDVIYFDANRFKQDNSPMGSQWGVSLSYIKSYGENAAMTFTTPSDPPSDLTATPVDASGNDGNAWVVTLVGNTQGTYTIRLSGTYYDPPIEVKPVEGKTNEWTLSMPGSDVVLTPIYAKAAAFATTGTEPEVKTLLPEAAEGVIAGTDAHLIAEGTGIVAFAGTSTEDTQGTLMYAVTPATATEAPALTAFSATVPTAEDYDDAVTLYVWYYIQGQDTPDGEDATLDNTFNNSDICATPLTVTVLSNKFDLTLNPANANTIDATDASKGTVSVKEGTGAAVDKTEYITNGKLEAVKMGSEVKLNAKQGYKFRKVEVKKNMPPSLTSATTDDVGKLVATDGSLFATADEVTAAGKTAAAMVAYVSSTGHGLAIALSNEDSYPRYSNAGSTAAAHQPVVTGHAWSLPTKEDWQNMIIGCGYTGGASDNMQISGLKTKLSAVGSSLPDGFYWTGSMADATYVWQFSPDGNNGSFASSVQSDSESELAVRAVLAF